MAISVCSTRSVEGTTFHFKISLHIKLVLFLVFLIFLSFPLHPPVSIRVCLMSAIKWLWLLLWISRFLSINNFLFPDQWTSRNEKLCDAILFQSTNTHKLSSIFPASAGVHKVALKNSLGQGQYGFILNSLRHLIFSAGQVLIKTPWPYDLENKELDRFHATLSPNNYKEET